MSLGQQEETVQATAFRVWALLLGIGLLLVGNGLQGSLLGLVAEDSGFASTVTGLVMTAYFAGFLVGSIVSERFISRVGHVRTFAALASLSSIAILVHGLYVEPVTWAAMRFLTGLSFAGLYVVAESWLNRETSSANRGSLLAIYMVITHLGLAVGQVLLNVAPAAGLALYVITSIILSAALLPILLSSTPQPHIAAGSERLSLGKLWQKTPLGTAGCFLAGAANGIVLGMSAVYARRLGLDVASISAFLAAIMIGGAVFQWPTGKLSDTFDRRRVILGVAVGSAVAALSLQLASGHTITLVLTGFVLGGLVLTLYPLFLSYANDWFEADEMVSASSGLVMVFGAGAMLGPLGTGLMMGVFGSLGYVLYLFALTLITAGYTAYRIAKTDGPANSEDFIYSPATTGISEVWAEAAAENAANTDIEESPEA